MGRCTLNLCHMYCNLFIPPQPLLTCISPPTPPPNCFSQAKLLKDIATHLKEGSDLAKITGAVPGAAQLKQIRKELSSENPTSPISPEWDKMVRKRKGRGGAVTETRDGTERKETQTRPQQQGQGRGQRKRSSLEQRRETKGGGRDRSWLQLVGRVCGMYIAPFLIPFPTFLFFLLPSPLPPGKRRSLDKVRRP